MQYPSFWFLFFCTAQNDQDTIFPKFTAGETAYADYISKSKLQLNNANKTSGTVFMKALIDTSRIVADVMIFKGINPAIDGVAIKIIKSTSGMWTSGTIRNKKTDLWIPQIISFTFR